MTSSRLQTGDFGAGAADRPDRGLLTARRGQVWSRAATHALCGIAPVFFTLYMLWFSVRHHAFAFDFDRAFWPAGLRVIHGASPYVSSTSFAATHGLAFVYPAPGALLFAAFAWLPRDLADVLFTVICMVAAAGTLWILGIRDWRIYGLTFLWPPVISGWQTANVSLLLALGIAVAWRNRDRASVCGATVGLIVALKIFLWPLLGWLLLTRRWRALAWSLAWAVAVNLVAWAVLGFDQLSAYTALASAVTKVEESTAYTPLALLLRLGAGRPAADAVAALLVLSVSFISVMYARRGRDSAVLLGAITISLLATPIVWRHYFVLFLVPLAILRPRLSLAWAIPILLLPVPVTAPLLWQLLLTLGAITALVFVLFRWPAPVNVFGDGRSRDLPGPGIAIPVGRAEPEAT